MRERDLSRHLAVGTVGAGAPSDPDVTDVPAPDAPDHPDESPMSSDSHEPLAADEPGNSGRPGECTATSEPGPPEANVGAAPPGPRTADDVVQAVADFLDDLVDDPGFAHDNRPTPDAP